MAQAAGLGYEETIEVHLRLALIAFAACLVLAGSQPGQTKAMKTSEIEIMMPSAESKGWRLLSAEEEALLLEDEPLEQASIVDDWLTTKPVTDQIPIPRAVLFLCGLFVVIGAYRVATRD